MKQIYIRRRKRRRRNKLMPYILGSAAIFILILLFLHLYLIDILNLRDKVAQEQKQPEFIEITELPVEKETKPPKQTKRLAEKSRDVPEETTRDNFTRQTANTPPVPPTEPKPAAKPQEQAKKVEKKPEEKPKKQITRSDITRKKEVASLPQKQLEKETKTTKELPNLTREQLFSSNPQPQTLPQTRSQPHDCLGAPNVEKKEETVNLSTTQFKYISYFNKLKRQIYSVWTYPKESGYRGEHGTLLLVFTIRSNGDLENVQLLHSSGYARLDNEALRAIRVAAPYPPFPKSWGGLEKLNIRANFVYESRSIF